MKTDRCIGMVALCGAWLLTALPSSMAAERNFYGSSNPFYGTSDSYFSASEAGDSQEEQLYSDATRAINEGRWSDAEPLLDQVSNLHGRRSDAAVYWKAY